MKVLDNPIKPWSTRTCETCHGNGFTYTGTRKHDCQGCNGQTTQVWDGRKWTSPADAGKQFYAMMTMPVNRRIEQPRSYRRY
jgi:DnaJ-class molecular chaperone